MFPHEIFKQWPDLKFLPRAEPSSAYEEDHKHWKKEYEDWRHRRCGRSRGYFCRRHGLWITCDEISCGIADQKHETPSSCPPIHDELEMDKANFFARLRQNQMDRLAANNKVNQAPAGSGIYNAYNPYPPGQTDDEQLSSMAHKHLSLDTAGDGHSVYHGDADYSDPSYSSPSYRGGTLAESTEGSTSHCAESPMTTPSHSNFGDAHSNAAYYPEDPQAYWAATGDPALGGSRPIDYQAGFKPEGQFYGSSQESWHGHDVGASPPDSVRKGYTGGSPYRKTSKPDSKADKGKGHGSSSSRRHSKK